MYLLFSKFFKIQVHNPCREELIELNPGISAFLKLDNCRLTVEIPFICIYLRRIEATTQQLFHGISATTTVS